MQCDFRVSLLLEIGDDALADQLGVADHVQDLVVLAVDQSQFESEINKNNNNEGTFFLEGPNLIKTFQIYFFHHNVMLSL